MPTFLENATTGCLANHRSFFGVVLADFVIREFNIGVNGMYKAAWVGHAQNLIWCYLGLRQLLRCLRRTFLVSWQGGHDVARSVAVFVIPSDDYIVLGLLVALDPVGCLTCF